MDERDFKPEEPSTIAVPGSINLWCPPPGGFENSPAGKLVTRVSTARIRPLDQKSPAPWWYRARQISGAPGRIRTVDTRFRRAVLYPLSYGGMLY